jgi:molecular chaperone Hsp33
MEAEHATEDSFAEVRCYFVRGRNALVARADFGPVYIDHYLHLMQHGLKPEPGHDERMKDALAACALHLASRPWAEVSAWTLHFGGDKPFNLFATGDSRLENVVSRVFTQDVRTDLQDLFVTQINEHPKEPRRSVVEFDPDHDVFEIVEGYYAKSEQRLSRFFRHGPEDFVMVTAQPDCDESWLLGLDDDSIRELDQNETLSLLEKRRYRYDCGCTLERLLPALARVSADELFGEDEVIHIDCPRCAANYRVERGMLDEL